MTGLSSSTNSLADPSSSPSISTQTSTNPFISTIMGSQGPASFPVLEDMLSSSKQWSERVRASQPDFFEKSAVAQNPKVLWIGCSDSRVPESVVCDRKPGEIFVHRNIANRYSQGDDSINAVLDFAVGVVKVRHVVVVGHESCGGCKAAFAAPKPATTVNDPNTPSTALQRFLQPLIELRHSLPEGSTLDDLTRANIKDGVEAIANSHAVKEDWANCKDGEEPVSVHGWMYSLSTGTLEDLQVSRLCGQGIPNGKS